MERNYRLIDTHAHLDFKDLRENIDEVIGNAKDAGVDKIIIPAVIIPEIPNIIDIIEEYDDVFGAVAVHPTEAKNWQGGDYQKLKEYALHEKVVAIGETGIDLYWDKTTLNKQIEVFREHFKLCRELNLPIIVHDRDAHAETLQVIKEFPEVIGVMHCFSGSAEFAMECIKEGYYVALGGPVTFKNAKTPKKVAQEVPLDKLLLETDSPYLTPHPFRGKTNDPAKIKLVAHEIANLRGMRFEDLANLTSINAEKLFKI